MIATLMSLNVESPGRTDLNKLFSVLFPRVNTDIGTKVFSGDHHFYGSHSIIT